MAPRRIHVLPDRLIDQIAAGEVVERPASVVKELVENAIDAGSSRIAIDIEEGGKRLIRVTDNGAGIRPDDLPLAVTRHATSKIRTLSDLTRAGTLGFRGEALPSIASVSRLTVRSTVEGGDEGCEIAIDGGSAPVIKPAPPAPGTTVEVADLFHNTPARQKYLKADTTEWGHIAETVAEVALGHPDIHFALTHNGKSARTYPMAPDTAGRVRQIYGAEVAEQLIPVTGEDAGAGLSVNGVIARPGFTRSGREQQKLLVNGRPIKNATVGHAVYQAYETNLPAGRHPVFFLSLTIEPARVDMNVHPAKREVRFADGKAIHRFVRQTVAESLGSYRGNALKLVRTAAPEGGPSPSNWLERVRQASARSVERAREPVAGYGAPPAATALPFDGGETAPNGDKEGVSPPLFGGHYRVVGQLHDTFVLVETPDGVRIIDQHTAHERVLFEALLARYEEHGLPAQRLMLPRDVTLSPKQAAAVTERTAELEKLGLEVEPFGGDCFLVRAVPESLQNADPAGLLADVADDLLEKPDGDAPMTATLHKVLATIACHAAVKAGDPLQPEQMTALIRDLEQVDNPHACPHGRAVTAVLDKARIKDLFDRNWGA